MAAPHRVLVGVLGLCLAAAVGVAYVKSSRDRDAYVHHASVLEIQVNAGCRDLASDLDYLAERLEARDGGPGPDGGSGLSRLDEMLGLHDDGSLAAARGQSWYREYLACGFARDWSTKEASDDAVAFAALKERTLYERGQPLATTLREMARRTRAVGAKPFHHGPP